MVQVVIRGFYSNYNIFFRETFSAAREDAQGL